MQKVGVLSGGSSSTEVLVQHWFAASVAGRCINGHFIAINMSRAGQASLIFCWLTFTFISLFSTGSGQDKQ